MRSGWMGLIVFVWFTGALMGSTFDYQAADTAQGATYSTGTATFTTGSTSVVGIGTAWVVGMQGGVMKANADTHWIKILTVVNPTHITLYSQYPDAGGIGVAYAMKPTPGWAGGGGTAGYSEAPISTLQYLMKMSNAVQRITLFGNIPLPVPNGRYWSSAFKVATWQFSFMEDYQLLYLMIFAPFVVISIVSFILLLYSLLRGLVTW